MVGAEPLDPGAVHRSSTVLSITEELGSSFVPGILTKAEVALGAEKKGALVVQALIWVSGNLAQFPVLPQSPQFRSVAHCPHFLFVKCEWK